MVFIDQLFIVRLLGFIIGLLLFFSAFRLINALKDKEIAASMIFLHKKRAMNLFGLLVVAAFFIFLTGIDFVIQGGEGLIDDVLLDLDAFTLLIFTFFMNRLMRGES